MGNYDSYIICATSRSGSTLLCKLLSATGVAGNPQSYFHVPSVAAWAEALSPRDQTVDRNADILGAVFNEARHQGAAGTGVFGLRLMRKSFGFLCGQLALQHPDCATDAERFQKEFGRVLYIHLSRDDKIAQAVSLVKAIRSGLWHIAPDGSELERSAPAGKLEYDVNHIRQELTKLQIGDRDWTRWFRAEQISPLYISYETLAANPVGELDRILNRLGLESHPTASVRPEVAQLADKTSVEWIRRFRAEAGNFS